GLAALMRGEAERGEILLVALAGGVVVGFIIQHFAPEAAGSGIPHALRSLALEGGRMPLRIVIWRPLATAITLGMGGSAGREGPIAHYGAGLGSTLGQWLNMSDERVKTLVASGAAAGISASFNAPIAGVFFALEVMLQDLSGYYFGMVVAASVAGGAVSRIVFPGEHFFKVPPYSLASPLELPFYALLGIMAAPIAVSFVYLTHHFRSFLRSKNLSPVARTTIGMGLTGLIGLGLPAISGAGFSHVNEDLKGLIPLQSAIRLGLGKFFATIFTVGAGASGGVFAPMLFIGSMFGSAFGNIVHDTFPAITDPPGAYALVGMAAMFAAVSHAPITSVLIIFELTGDYYLMLPLMLATVLSTFVSETLNRDSFYTYSLAREGLHVGGQAQVEDILRGLQVAEAMFTNITMISPSTTLRDLSRLFAKAHKRAFPVVDDKGCLLGLVAISDVARAIAQGKDENATTAQDVMVRSVVVTYPDEPLWIAKRRLRAKDLGRLLVVDRKQHRKLLGIVREEDIGQAYSQALLRMVQLEHRVELLKLGHLEHIASLEFQCPSNSILHGKKLEAISWPVECVVTHIRRGSRMIIPRGQHQIEAGDFLTIMVAEEDMQSLKAFLNSRERDAET
ncbi:MAG: CBS domain-containing protein, partial [Caldilineae bacterium]